MQESRQLASMSKPVSIRANKITRGTIHRAELHNPIKRKTGRARHSVWWITVSPNIQFKNPDDPVIDLLGDALEDVLRAIIFDDEEFLDMLKISKNVKNKTINTAESKVVIERGDQTGAPHGHALIIVQHNSKIHLAYDKFPKQILKDLKRTCKARDLPIPKGLHFDANILEEASVNLDDKQAIIDYMLKNVNVSDNARYVGKEGEEEFIPLNEHPGQHPIIQEDISADIEEEDSPNGYYDVEEYDDIFPIDDLDRDEPEPDSESWFPTPYQQLPEEEPEQKELPKEGEVEFVPLRLPKLIDIREQSLDE